jgi:GNAT superfamily N-acetyltransferase
MSPIVSSLVFRRLEPSETAAAAKLACEVFDQFVAPHYQAEGVTEFHRYASADALSQRHASGHATYVAERGGELAGMLHLRAPRHVAMLFVQASLQRHGIARALLAAAGDVNCEFTVNSSPNAVGAYERLGFRVTGSEQCVHGIRFIPMQRRSAGTGVLRAAISVLVFALTFLAACASDRQVKEPPPERSLFESPDADSLH